MIITKLQGGLGNQMFQYAAARGIKLGSEPVLLDTGFLKTNTESSAKFTARDFELHLFPKLQAREATSRELNFVLGRSLQHRLLRFLRGGVTIVHQKENEFVPGIDKQGSNLYLDGFFQSERYFSNIRRKLCEEFSFPPLTGENLKYLAQIRACGQPVSIHVRRGDYLKPQVLRYHGVLPAAYYKQAITLLGSVVASAHFFIFSNDAEWCMKYFGFLGPHYTIVAPNDAANAWQEMYLMTQCRHHIVANSSFSWWGAWLSEHNGINLAPAKWFNPGVAKFDIHDFVPPHWKIVHYD